MTWYEIITYVNEQVRATGWFTIFIARYITNIFSALTIFSDSFYMCAHFGLYDNAGAAIVFYNLLLAFKFRGLYT